MTYQTRDFPEGFATKRWSTSGWFPPNLDGYVTKVAPHKALKLIARGKSTSDERVALHCAEGNNTSNMSGPLVFFEPDTCL